MYLFGFSIDNISLLGLTLAVGLVVDDAIVMLENIVRHVEEDGMTPFEAALKGQREIGFTIISITVSLVAVFIPVLLMGGVIGRIFNEFAMVVTISIVASALRLADADADAGARALPAEGHGARPGATKNLFERGFDRVLAGYRVLLDLCLRFRFMMFLVFLATVGCTGLACSRDPEGLLPDRGHRPAAGHDRGPPGHLLRRRWSTCSARSRMSCDARPTSRMWSSSVGSHTASARQRMNPGRFSSS